MRDGENMSFVFTKLRILNCARFGGLRECACLLFKINLVVLWLFNKFSANRMDISTKKNTENVPMSDPHPFFR